AFESQTINSPIVIRAVPGGSGTNVAGWIHGEANTTFTLQFFSGTTCDPAALVQTSLGTASVTTDAGGTQYFSVDVLAVPAGQVFVAAAATDASGKISAFSPCVRVGPGNTSWPNALPLTLTSSGVVLSTTYPQSLEQLGESRWYSFTVQPGSRVIVTLTGLPAN